MRRSRESKRSLMALALLGWLASTGLACCRRPPVAVCPACPTTSPQRLACVLPADPDQVTVEPVVDGCPEHLVCQSPSGYAWTVRMMADERAWRAETRHRCDPPAPSSGRATDADAYADGARP